MTITAWASTKFSWGVACAALTLTTMAMPSAAYADGVSIDDLVRRDCRSYKPHKYGCRYYKKYSNTPFTGTTVTETPSGGRSLVTFRNGKRHGESLTFRKNGQLSYKSNYKNGYPHGVLYSYHENGQIKSKTTYKNGWATGPSTSYYDNGQIDSQGNFYEFSNIGKWVGFYRDGNKRSVTYYKDGGQQGDQLYWKEDGSLNTEKSGYYKEDKRVGPLKNR